jgi:hypothetical protein
MQYSSRFSFSNGKLWRCDTHRKHKIVVPKEKRYELLKEVHDILGHKKIHAVRMQRLEWFWWPFLDQDVKWFVQTCHQLSGDTGGSADASEYPHERLE